MISTNTKSNLEIQNIPFITLAITCYNAEKTIERALDSAFDQDWPNFEIIIIDDGSKDNSVKLIKKWSLNHEKLIMLFNENNQGCAFSRNKIIEKAKGEFIAFFDDDDFSQPDRIRLQYEKVIEYENLKGTQLVACFASGQRIYSNGYIKHFNSVGSKGNAPIGMQMANYLLYFERFKGIDYGGGVPTCSLFLRTSVFKNFGAFDPSMKRQEDVDFAIRIAMNGAHFIGVKKSLVKQYVTNSNDKAAIIEYQSSSLLIEKYHSYLESKNLYKYMLLWTKLRYYHFISKEFKAIIILIKLLIYYPLRSSQHFFYSATRRFLHEQLIYSREDHLNLRHKCVKLLSKFL